MKKNNLRQPLFYLGVIFILILFIRLPSLAVPIYNVDEAAFAVIGNSIIDGQLIYRDIPDHAAPLTPYFYALVFLLSGKNNMFAIHAALVLLIFGICVVLYRICALAGKKNAGYLAALFFGIFSYTYTASDVLAFETEWLSVLFSSLGAYFLLNYYFKNKPFSLFISGLFSALAFFSKQLSLPVYAISLLFCCVFAYYNNKKTSAVFKAFLLNLSGFSAVFFLVIYYFYINNASSDFRFWFWSYNNQYYVSAVPLTQRISSALLYFIQRGSFFAVNYLLAILFVTAVAITGWASFQSFARRKGLLIDWYLIAWAVFAYLGAAYSGRHFGHYYIIALGPFCLIAAATVQILLDASDSRGSKQTAAGLNIPVIGILIIVVIFHGIFSPFYLHAGRLKEWKLPWQKDARRYYLPKPPYELSEYIKSNSGKQEKIFVWGFYPEIYVLAERMPAARYINCNFLTGMIPWTNWQPGIDTSYTIVPGAWKIFMEEMERNKPKFIIDTSVGDINFYAKYPPEKFVLLYTFLQDNYKISKIFFKENGMPYVRLWERIN